MRVLLGSERARAVGRASIALTVASLQLSTRTSLKITGRKPESCPARGLNRLDV